MAQGSAAFAGEAKETVKAVEGDTPEAHVTDVASIEASETARRSFDRRGRSGDQRALHLPRHRRGSAGRRLDGVPDRRLQQLGDRRARPPTTSCWKVSRSWVDQASGEIKTVEERLSVPLVAPGTRELTVTQAARNRSRVQAGRTGVREGRRARRVGAIDRALDGIGRDAFGQRTIQRLSARPPVRPPVRAQAWVRGRPGAGSGSGAGRDRRPVPRRVLRSARASARLSVPASPGVGSKGRFGRGFADPIVTWPRTVLSPVVSSK